MTSYQQYREDGELGLWQDVEHVFSNITGEKYEGHDSPHQLLLNIWSEADAKVKKSKENANSSQLPRIPQQNLNQSVKQETTPEQSQEDNYTCFECLKKKNGEYFYNAKVSEGEKLCSENCYLEYWGKICNVCRNKFLKFHRDDNQFIYCDVCWKSYWNNKVNELKKEQSKNKEEMEIIKKKLKELDERKRENDEIINSLGNNQSELVDNHKNSNINKDNLNMNTAERERERERESNLTENNPANNNYLIYWTIGIIGVSCLGLISFFLIKNNKQNKRSWN